MKQTRILMGMPVSVEIVDKYVKEDDINNVYEYFHYIDEKFSTYKKTSEMSQINRGFLKKSGYSDDMKLVLRLCEETKKQSRGYFDISHNGKLDPSGLVKGWAIYNAGKILKKRGFKNFYIDAGGDIQVSGKNKDGENWKIGIRNPFNRRENVKVLSIFDRGVATSGTAVRGNHIYNPKNNFNKNPEIVSLTVIGPNIYEADRFATAAFAMGRAGIHFIESIYGLEGYMINLDGISTYTSGFEKYTVSI